MRLAVIGTPVRQSLSPLIHNAWLQQYKIDAEYDAIEIMPDNLERFCTELRQENWRGCNVTIPHKENIMRYLDDIDPAARRIGAVNTVINLDGRLTGYNTDGFGFIENLKTQQANCNFSKPVIVLGAGGAARGIINALIEQGVTRIIVVNRDQNKAQQMQNDFASSSIRVCDWSDFSDDLRDAGLLINTTSLGMTGQPALMIDLALLPMDAVVYDIVYKPLQTNLLQQAARLNLKTVDGLGMLLHQARLSFYHWFDILPDIKDYQKLCLNLEQDHI